MGKIKKIIALILAMLLIFTSLPTSVFATTTEASVAFAGGDGTAENPYQVSTPEQLDAVRNNLSAHYVQINDIDLTDYGLWQPIGAGESLSSSTLVKQLPEAENNPFTGSYDGNSYLIKGLRIQNRNISFTNDCFGLFAYVNNGVLKNIKLLDVDFFIDKSSTDYAEPILFTAQL